MNYFDPKSAAERYAKGRPNFHSQVIRRIRAYLNLTEPVAQAIDVGCGTGLSTIALKEIARHIVGVDSSREMLSLAPADSRIEYQLAPAEKLPAQEAEFDLMTLSSVFHWINLCAFFAEARRVLRPRAWLVVYDNYFLAQMEGNSKFQNWNQETYLQKYPSPPRHRVGFGAEDSEKEGFQFLGQEHYQNSVKFSAETLVDYLVTHSNVIAAVEGGGETIDGVRSWLLENVCSFFGNRSEATFFFGGPIWYMQKGR